MILSAIEENYGIESAVIQELAETFPFADDDFDFDVGYGTTVKVEQN